MSYGNPTIIGGRINPFPFEGDETQFRWGAGCGNSIVNSWLNELTVQPSEAFTAALCTFITDIQDAGITDNLERLWIFATEEEEHAKRSIINPTSTLITVNGSPTWTANEGYTGDGATAYLDTGLLLSTATKYAQDDASYGFYSRTAAASEGAGAGAFDTVGQKFVAMYHRYTDDTFYGAINDSVGDYNAFANANGSGMYAMTRVEAGSTVPYKNGVAKPAASIASAVPPALTLYLLNVNTDGAPDPFSYYNGQLSMAFVGNGLVDNAALYSAFQTFATTRGFAV